jgi:protein-arginine kinase activator protein McsA
MAAKKAKETKEKPLDKMTVKELRDIAKELEGISGVHGMNKAELLSAVKESRGISEEKKTADDSVRAIKLKIRELKSLRESALKSDDSKTAAIYRRKISRLKKRTRRAA